MVSLIVHAILGVLVIVWIVRANPHVFARPTTGPRSRRSRSRSNVIGVASIALGYYFNHQFVAQYAVEGGNPIWGLAAGSSSSHSLRQPGGRFGSQDYTSST